MKRPLAVTILGWAFIAAGAVGLVYHAVEIGVEPPGEVVWVLILRALAIIGGAFALRGTDWSRWLLAGWMAYHVLIGFRHSMSEAVTHAVLLVVVGIVCFVAPGSAWFRRGR